MARLRWHYTKLHTELTQFTECVASILSGSILLIALFPTRQYLYQSGPILLIAFLPTRRYLPSDRSVLSTVTIRVLSWRTTWTECQLLLSRWSPTVSTVLPLPKLVVTLTWPWCNSINMTSMVPGEEVSTSIPSGNRVLKRKKMSSNLVWVLLFRVTLTYDTPLKDTRVASEGKNHKSDQISTSYNCKPWL